MSISSYLALIIIVIVINAAAEAVRAEGAQSVDCADARANARPCTHDRPCREAEGA